jgi:hypothetical protein
MLQTCLSAALKTLPNAANDWQWYKYNNFTSLERITANLEALRPPCSYDRLPRDRITAANRYRCQAPPTAKAI